MKRKLNITLYNSPVIKSMAWLTENMLNLYDDLAEFAIDNRDMSRAESSTDVHECEVVVYDGRMSIEDSSLVFSFEIEVNGRIGESILDGLHEKSVRGFLCNKIKNCVQ